MSLAAIDWQRPWLAPFRALGEPLATSNDWIAAANRLAVERCLSNPTGRPLRFIPQQQLPAGLPYEAHIAASGQVPTRDNLHDFFNALAWLHFPQTKRQLNALHTPALPTQASPGTRGRQRDAATLFDENAAWVVSDDAEFLAALREHRWHQALMRSPEQFRAHADVVLFGHALMEKLVTPYKSITAHVWIVAVDSCCFGLSPADRLCALDSWVAASISQGFSSRDFCHLPVLGVPGWWSGQNQLFYDDVEVFRPKRGSA
jgi:hypothetical protein